MSDTPKPLVLTLLATVAIITGVFSVIHGVLMIAGGINQLLSGVGGMFQILFGVLILAVGVLALMSGIMVLKGRSGGIEWMKRYAIGLALYNLLWVIYASVSGEKVSWLLVILQLGIAGVTVAMLKTNEEIQKYLETE
jgi:hypothetical protein